jgi:hypothetical protein
MPNFKIRFIDLLYWLAIIGADLFVFIILGILLMGYDDNYDSSKGGYWSWTSMNTSQKMIYAAYLGWIILNIIGLVYIVFKLYRQIDKRVRKRDK